MTIKVDTRAIRLSKKQIMSTVKRMQKPQPAMKRIGDYFAMRSKKKFSTNGSYDGKPWRPLKPEYLQWKIQNGYSKNALVRSGKLRGSYVSRPMSLEKYNKYTALYGSKIKYAKFHEDGTRNMAARQVMNVTRKVEKDVVAIIAEYIVNGKKANIQRLLK